jgi:hypothetical protein
MLSALRTLAQRTVALKQRLALRSRLQAYLRWWYRRKIIKTGCGLEIWRNWRIDRKYGGWCGGSYETRFEDTGAHGTSSIDYWQMPGVFDARNGLAIGPDDVLVDVGCGKGRVINWWLEQGLANKIIGIELDERFARPAAQRLRPFPNVTILHGNALDLIPPDGTIFFLFNPFNGTTLRAFLDRLLEVCGNRKNLTVVYYLCVFVNDLEDHPRWLVEHGVTKTFYPLAVLRPREAPVAALKGDRAPERVASC